MNTTEPKRPDSEAVVTDEEREIFIERLKTLEEDRKTARPSGEVFRRILQKPKRCLHDRRNPKILSELPR